MYGGIFGAFLACLCLVLIVFGDISDFSVELKNTVCGYNHVCFLLTG